MNKMNNNKESKIVTKGEMRKMVNEMQAPEDLNGVGREKCANCKNLIECAIRQQEIIKNRVNKNPEPRQLPLFECVTKLFKEYVAVDRKLF